MVMINSQIPTDLRRLLPLTPAVFFVLFALANGPKHGYAIMQNVRVLSDERVRLGPGTLYSTIQRLLELDLIEETAGTGEPSDHESRRRYYKLNSIGRNVLEGELSRMDSLMRLAKKKKLFPQTAK
jgi:DNA-binding PadR family transcriptional regulator